MHTTIGVIGGTGLYTMPELHNTQTHTTTTPYGPTSSPIITGTLGNTPVAFLARHGTNHQLLPTEVPYRANIHALKQHGVKYLISVSAVGSLHKDLHPLDVVIPHQFIDLTKHRTKTFFGDGAVAHISLANPVCLNLANILADAATQHTTHDNRNVHTGHTYACIEGPAFSSKAESAWLRSMDAHIVGMTNMPEAALAREAQIAYSTVAMVTDYDCWHPTEEPVTTDMAIARLRSNAELAQHIIKNAVATLNTTPPTSDAHTALAAAMITPPEAMPQDVHDRLKVLWEA